MTHTGESYEHTIVAVPQYALFDQDGNLVETKSHSSFYTIVPTFLWPFDISTFNYDKRKPGEVINSSGVSWLIRRKVSSLEGAVHAVLRGVNMPRSSLPNKKIVKRAELVVIATRFDAVKPNARSNLFDALLAEEALATTLYDFRSRQGGIFKRVDKAFQTQRLAMIVNCSEDLIANLQQPKVHIVYG